MTGLQARWTLLYLDWQKLLEFDFLRAISLPSWFKLSREFDADHDHTKLPMVDCLVGCRVFIRGSGVGAGPRGWRSRSAGVDRRRAHGTGRNSEYRRMECRAAVWMDPDASP